MYIQIQLFFTEEVRSLGGQGSKTGEKPLAPFIARVGELN